MFGRIVRWFRGKESVVGRDSAEIVADDGVLKGEVVPMDWEGGEESVVARVRASIAAI